MTRIAYELSNSMRVRRYEALLDIPQDCFHQVERRLADLEAPEKEVDALFESHQPNMRRVERTLSRIFLSPFTSSHGIISRQTI